MAYSERINDTAFQRYLQKTNRWAWIFTIILCAVAIVGFFIAGENSKEMDNPQSLFIGLGIAALIFVINLFRYFGVKNSTTWDGVVFKKTAQKKRESVDHDSNATRTYIEYVVHIKRDSDGKKFKLAAKNNPSVFNYYREGDKVRHHAGLNTYEKFDKSDDTYIFCNACHTKNDIENDVCKRCKCPLLK